MQDDLDMSLKKATYPAIYFLKHAFNDSTVCVLCIIKTEVHYNDSSYCQSFC